MINQRIRPDIVTSKRSGKRSMTTIRVRLTAYAFAILLLLPALDQALNLSSRFTSTENRQLKRMPSLNFPHLRSFVFQFDQYYKENFGWRNALFYLYSQWKFNGLGQSPLPEKVVVGKNGWLFLGNNGNGVIDQHRGLRPLSADSACLITDHLLQWQQKMDRRGIRFYVMVAPNSHTIYQENLPDHLQKSMEPSRLDVLRRAVSQTKLRFVGIRDMLLAAKPGHVLYYQTDTHWNDYGTLVGSLALLNRIRAEVPSLSPTPISLSDYQVEQHPRGVSGDLTTMLMLQDSHPKDSATYVITPPPDRMGQKIAVVPNTNHKLPSTRFLGSGSAKLLFIGDSFSEGMMQFLPGYFRESYFIRDNQLSDSLVRRERPQVVVIEIVERNIDKLATF